MKIFFNKIPFWRCAMCLLATLAITSGSQPNSDYPPPGKMRVVSITPLQVLTRDNLIANGNFAKWWPGSPVGEGFGAPAPTYSTVSRGGDEAHAVAIQTWSRVDTELDSARLFRTQVNNLKPNIPYRLAVSVYDVEDGSVTLSIFSMKDKTATPLHPNLITLIPGAQESAEKVYSADFKVPEGGSILIAANLVSPGTGQTTVTWKEWRLFPVEDAQ